MGRLVAELDRQRSAGKADDVQIISPRLPGSYTKLLRRGKLRSAIKWLRGNRRLQREWKQSLASEQLLDEESVVLIHPRTLGHKWCGELIQRRRHPTWFYLVDTSYFCARSYNYIEGNGEACLHCLGGQWQHAARLNCYAGVNHPEQQEAFSEELRAHASSGKAKFLVQNCGQRELAQSHFGADATVVTVGLWTIDMPDEIAGATTFAGGTNSYDVVFHGAPVPAKGFTWALDLAKRCPHLEFLFPCSRRRAASVMSDVPENARFAKMTWESGLSDAVRNAKLVLVPSLWSAPIEGALIKSIGFGRTVAVADQQTAFSAEIPDDLVVRLPVNLDDAARRLAAAAQTGWQPAEDLRRRWFQTFRDENRNLLNQLRIAVEPKRIPLAVCG